MKITELKIGDWVDAGDLECKNLECKVVGIEGNHVFVDHKDFYVVRYDELSPITLTPEILKKNGWEEKKKEFSEGVIYTNGWYVSSKSEEGGFWMFSHYDDFLTTIKYVHQLQHLLWALGIDDDLKI